MMELMITKDFVVNLSPSAPNKALMSPILASIGFEFSCATSRLARTAYTGLRTYINSNASARHTPTEIANKYHFDILTQECAKIYKIRIV